MSTERRRLAVLGSPIAHSKSPALHDAAYAVLGLDWEYEAIDVAAHALPAFVASRTPEWRGLSLTMPLKRAVLPLLDSRDEATGLTAAANTVLFDDDGERRVLRGFNTDVHGIVEAFRGAGVERLGFVRVLGSGATAASVLLAVSRLGAARVAISARTPAAAADLQRLGGELGVQVRIEPLGTQQGHPVPDAVVSTIPGGVELPVSFADEVMTRSVLFEVAYDPWPTPLAASWLSVGGQVISGLEMLINQALGQVRTFVGGEPDIRLPGEAAVLQAMRRSIASG